MGNKSQFTFEEMRDTLRYMEPIFDMVRVVDPAETAVLHLEADGTIKKECYACFTVWGKSKRCEHCTSRNALLEGCQHSKYEFIKSGLFYVVSRPLHLVNGKEDLPVVLEIVSHVSDQLLLEHYEGKSISEWADETYNKIYKDELTKAFNRRFLNEMEFLRRQAKVSARHLALVLLDIHKFKRINDTYGHLAGDRILTEISSKLREHVRNQDSVIRIGGDEFLVTLVDCDENMVQKKIEEFQNALGEIYCDDKKTEQVQAEYGYSCTKQFEPNEKFLKEMLDEADRGMYKNK